MPDNLSIRELNDAILGGRIRVPAFQRGFVWDAELVAMLMDSLYKRYPIGSVLLWRTKAPLRTERRLGPFALPEHDPDYPIDYVLDGQQRITSVFGVFQTDLEPVEDSDWLPVYFDFAAGLDPQESQFLALRDEDVDPSRHFALKTVFDSPAYRMATAGFDTETAARIDEMSNQFKELRLPVDVFVTEDRARVGIVFERVNRLGVALDTFQLLSAWTWSEDFDLQEEFSSLAEALEPFGFSGVGEDTTLLLRCCAAVVAGDASPEALVNLNGTEVRNRFQEIRNGIEGAIDFLRTNLEVHSIVNLPFSTLLVPLAAFFAVPGTRGVPMSDSQRRTLLKWFWRSCFTRRFSSGVLRNLNSDIQAAKELRTAGQSDLGSFQASVSTDFFLKSRFNIGSVNSKTLILLLAQKHPYSFVSGALVELGEVLRSYNRREFHHCYPREYLNSLGVAPNRRDSLANFAFISAQDNKTISGAAPSKYREKMPDAHLEAIMSRAFLPNTFFDDNFDAFLEERAALLTAFAEGLLNEGH